MQTLLKIALLFCAVNSIAQTTFFNYYNNDNNYKLSFDRGSKLLEVTDGYIIMGYISEDEESIRTGTPSFQDTTRPMFLKIDKYGNVLWNKRYNNNTCSFTTSNFIKNGNNEYIGVGNSLTYGDTCLALPNPPIVDNQVYIQKINDSGNIIWQKNYGETFTKSPQSAYDICPTKDGNYFVIAEDKYTHWLLKLNENGDTLWSKKYLSLYNKSPNNIVSVSDGYLITFQDNSLGTSRILKINEQGDSLWIKNLTSFYAVNIKPTDDGNFILQNNSFPTSLLKIDANANELWRQSYNLNASLGFCVINNDDFVICNKDFAMVNSLGNIKWNKRFFGTNNINPWYYIHAVIHTSDGGYLATGFYNGDTFAIKTDCNGNIIWDSNSCIFQSDNDALIFPNPFTDILTIQLPKINKENDIVEIDFINSLGQLCYHQIFSNQNIFTLNESILSPGIYIIKIQVNQQTYKIVKVLKQ